MFIFPSMERIFMIPQTCFSVPSPPSVCGCYDALSNEGHNHKLEYHAPNSCSERWNDLLNVTQQVITTEALVKKLRALGSSPGADRPKLCTLK